MKTCLQTTTRKTVFNLAAGLAAVLLGAGANTSHAQTLPAGVQDVVKLTQAGVSNDIILNPIKKIMTRAQPVTEILMTAGDAMTNMTNIPDDRIDILQT
jgi:hypothetical protein